ncbi:MAG: protease B nonderepressible form [Peltula sp. TS41687]|nr:MAG: protease B nonderepressible form [Peltula sp. TS41687]
MKQRITYIRQKSDPFHEDTLQVTKEEKKTLNIKDLKAAKEHRISLDLDELPDEKSFIKIPVVSERFSSATSLQYYNLLPSLKNFVSYIQRQACHHDEGRASSLSACYNNISTLLSASYVDIDFDAISHILSIHAFWPASAKPNGWSETFARSRSQDKIEVGVLEAEKPTEPEELSFSGFLTVVGEDDKPAATLFSFSSRHHSLPRSSSSSTNANTTSYTISLPPPTGLHPTLRITLARSSSAPSSFPSCSLHTYLSLPSPFIIDKYQLSDPLFLAAKNIHSIRSLYGATDLEAPDWVMQTWGSALLLELVPPPPLTSSGTNHNNKNNWEVDIPLHLRYLPPGQTEHEEVHLPWPTVFWACKADAAGTKMAVNPFDRRHLGYEGLFGDKTMFFHWEPETKREVLVERVHVPVLDLKRVGGGGRVEWITVVVVLLGFGWVCWRLGGVLRLRGGGGREGEKEKKDR